MTHPLRDYLEARLWNGDLYYVGNIEGIDIYKPLRQEWLHDDRPATPMPMQPDTATPVV
jgi:hypothetical protein